MQDITSYSSSLINKKMTVEAFQQLAGELSGQMFVKTVFDKTTNAYHFINQNEYQFHVDYIAEKILGLSKEDMRAKIDDFNQWVYLDSDRRFYLGVLGLNQKRNFKNRLKKFLTLETVEVDNMNTCMMKEFYKQTKEHLSTRWQLYFKPANHEQEKKLREIGPRQLPRIFNYELGLNKTYIPLNDGIAEGRLRVFLNYQDYRSARDSIEWYDILVMDRVPDNIPRVSGIINNRPTTPLSHTNVLAHGWNIPNAIEEGIINTIIEKNLQNEWVQIQVDDKAKNIKLKKVKKPKELGRPLWQNNQVKIAGPKMFEHNIRPLTDIRLDDIGIFGTKSANLGELFHVFDNGSEKLAGFYRVKHPPRDNLLGYLKKLLNTQELESIDKEAHQFLKDNIRIPQGIALPFSIQQEFLATYPHIQQQIGKLKFALELGIKEIEPLCLKLQQMIIKAEITPLIKNKIQSAIALHLTGRESFVVRSSSNAEDLQNFSAAGIYESRNHVTTSKRIFKSIKEVWASLVSPRSVHLRQDVNISLDDTYMGVIIQEEVKCDLGGVLVTTNPLRPGVDIRNVYINANPKSVIDVVEGNELPYQYLFNTLEGGGRTISLGSNAADLDDKYKDVLQKLAIAGRLLQSHFSEDNTFSSPVDIEWAYDGEHIYILQLRPYARQ